jgi:uncharacterized integral membrane protein (TIGR00698 family)
MERSLKGLKNTVIASAEEIKDSYTAVLIIILSGLLAYFISTIDPAFDALFLALFFGIIVGSLYRSEKKDIISQKALSITLPIGIVLYGANVVFPKGIHIPPVFIALALFSTILLGITVFLLCRYLHLGGKFTALLACGNAICGASAIAIISSIINPRKEEFSASIIVITVVGLTGAVIYPSLYYLLNLSDIKYALLSGATLQQTGLVKIASKQLGENIETLALGVKAIRIAMIAVVALIISFFYSQQRFYVPWYVVGFILLAFLSENLLPLALIKTLQPLSTIAFSITLSSIGFSVNLSDIQNVRLSPLIVVYSGWTFSVLVLLIVLVLL